MTNRVSDNTRAYHFIGCGGAGMAPLAHIMLQQGCQVSGSDIQDNYQTAALQAAGAVITIGHAAANLPVAESPTVIFSSAVKEDNPELLLARQHGLQCLRRGNMLAEIADSYRRAVAIGGSHGKTTVTAMLTHILRHRQLDCGFMVGGKVNGWQCAAAAGDGDIFVCEVDESDGTIAAAAPYLGILTNIEDDHSWSVGGQEALLNNFRRFARQSARLLCFSATAQKLMGSGIENMLVLEPAECLMRYELPAEWGEYQRLNGCLAIQAAHYLGVAVESAVTALHSFPGVARRMITHLDTPKLTVIEDYAHHPTEVAAVLQTLRRRFPQHHLRVVFQPHRYARLERYLHDFVRELSCADTVYVTPVFAAWSERGRITASDLVKLIGDRAYEVGNNWSDTAETVRKASADKPLLIAVLGAGDIDRIIPFLTH